MEYRPFGSTGLQVSKIALGGGTLSSLFGYVMYKYVHMYIKLSVSLTINSRIKLNQVPE